MGASPRKRALTVDRRRRVFFSPPVFFLVRSQRTTPLFGIGGVPITPFYLWGIDVIHLNDNSVFVSSEAAIAFRV
jgi:hypothetical protein